MLRCLGTALVLVGLGACTENPAGVTVAAGREFQVGLGETVTVEGTGLVLRFEAVPRDSRCPSNAICVALGDAEAVFSVTASGRPTTGVSLHTDPAEVQRATIGQWTLTLTQLDPYPYAGRTIAASEYRASLRVDRAPGS